jgi:hypothetical protein
VPQQLCPTDHFKSVKYTPLPKFGPLPFLLILISYAAASFIHHLHNAEYLNEYPNLPAWLTRAQVYAAWLGTTAVGVTGYFLVLKRHTRSGLLLLTLYGILGLYGLAHYAVASFGSHSAVMNFTIWFEVSTATLLIIAIIRSYSLLNSASQNK